MKQQQRHAWLWRAAGLCPFAAVALSLLTGWITLPLPYPAVRQYPHPSSAYPWRPSPVDKGLFAVRHKLVATRLFEGHVHGSESVTVAPDGRFIMLDRYGAVREAVQGPGGGQQLVLNPEPLAHLGPGRPLGAAFDGAGSLIICDAFKGLIKLHTATKRVEVLANRVSPSSPLQPGSPITYANDLDVGPDGTVYFTDSVDVSPHRNAQHENNVSHIISIQGQAGFYDTAKGWALGMLQGLPKGRVLAYFPANRTTHVLAESLFYSNGVALAADGSYVAVAETDMLRVLKLYLPPHPRAGSLDVLIDALPGTPDGISRAPDGAFWVSLVSSVPGFTKYFGSTLVRGLLGWIPENWRPQVPTWGAVLKVSPGGALQQWLVDLTGEGVSKVSSAHEHGGRLFLGNLAGDYVSVVDLASLPPDGEEREALREQLCAVPAEGDPTDIAINMAKLRDLQARLLEEREEKATLAGEKAALSARLAKLKDAGTDELREKAELQEALVRSEEQRLDVSRALIDFQMETNEAKQGWANTKFSLEGRIMELEAGRLEHHVRVEDHAALADERDSLARRLREADDETARTRKALEAERQQSSEAAQEVRRLNKLLAALEAASAGNLRALLHDTDDSFDGPAQPAAATYGAGGRSTASAAGGAGSGTASRVNLSEVRLQLQKQLKQQERRIAELESQVAESQQQLEAAQSNRSVTQEALDQSRATFKRKMEAAAREVAELAQRVALANGEPGHALSVGPDVLLSKAVRYLDEVVQVCQDSISEARRDAESLSGRHTQLRRRCRQLYTGYRALRYTLADEWPPNAGSAPPRVAHEDAIVGGSIEDILRADDEADRQALVRQQNKVAALEAQLASLQARQLEHDTLGSSGQGRLTKALTSSSNGSSVSLGTSAAALQLENSRLREELDALKRRLPSLGLLRRTCSSVGGAGQGGAAESSAAVEQLVAALAQARSENERLRAAAAAQGRPPAEGMSGPAGAVDATGAVLRKQVKDFAQGAQLDLQRQLKAFEARAIMAEEQLSHLQRYIAAASVAYQREIMRLHGALQKLDPTATAKLPHIPAG